MKATILLATSALIAASAAISASAQTLWKVTGNHTDGASYLFGTHHIAPASVYEDNKDFNKALSRVDFVITEAPMPDTPQGNQEFAQLTMKMAAAPADSTLTAILAPEQIDSLNAVLAKYTGGQLSAQALAAFKPSLVTTQLAMMQTMAAFPKFDMNRQLDTEIARYAREKGKQMLALESLEEQLDVLFGAPVVDQAADLMESVRNDDKSAAKAMALANAYMEKDADAIEKLIFDDPDNDLDSEMFKRLFTRRNADWMARLCGQLPQHNVMVVVGIGHLVGDDGLVKSLRRAGYTVTPVTDSAMQSR